MADPQTSGPRRTEAELAAEDEGRIEHLLVTGLDHYFAGEFEAAINLWTRVLFLDRAHDRARAYIDRARSAQAEQQRISEALVHEGLAAFDKGEVIRARALLSDALDQGASHDVALGVLGRIDRLDAVTRSAAPVSPAIRRRAQSRPSAAADVNAQPGRLALWWATAAAIVLVAAISFVLVAPNGFAEWFPVQATTGRPAALVAPPAEVPVPSPTEAYVGRARALFASGKLRDALRALDRVPVGDALRPEAERIRADIQRELLAVAGAEAASASSITPSAAPPKE
jgi:tetratricopeptide (TPR) repeat protein